MLHQYAVSIGRVEGAILGEGGGYSVGVVLCSLGRDTLGSDFGRDILGPEGQI